MRGRSLASTLVRCQTRSNFAHSALLYPDGRTIIESYPGHGVRKKLLHDWDDVVAFSLHGVTSEQWRRAYAFAEAQIGKPYDWYSVLCFLTRDKPPKNDNWFCSELTMAAMQAGGVNLLARIPPYKVYPGMLAYSPLLIQCPPVK